MRAHSKADGEAVELTDIRKTAAATATSGDADVETGGGTQARVPSIQDDAPAPIDPAREAEYRRKSLIHFVALCWSLFVNGWHDASTGPMLPRIQEKYNIGFAIVSLLFVCGAVGFLSGAFINVYLTDRLGFGKVLVLGAVCQIGAYVMIVPSGPFPVLCLSYLLIGVTLSLQAAQATGFVAVLKKNSREKLSMLHGTYGLGALISPLVATHFAQDPEHWSFHFIISAGLYVTNAAFLWAVFRGRRQEVIMEEEGESAAQDDAGSNKFKQMMRIKSVHALSFFALIYVGIEVTLGGWSVTYILEKRGGSSNSGYISSGFFGGIMLGRFVLLWLNRKLGERRALFLYAILTIGLEVTVWVVPSLIENAVAVSFVGLLLGPMFPILMNHSTTILPRWLMTACSGYIAGAGQAGSAVLPFITGLLAQKFGIASLQPFVVSMMSTLIVLWAVIPRARYVPT
ncbi:MFS general substrate transporter [Lentinus tigrinus ALCF2SS1-7]|uniref:MFS general substrate transporter n=1 Tax=Lentinus tigrinus ALCF2SS1-7 TaxID=1328758 RepID=UPI0011662383|nr:MFS general substrate transporter [Lentinus tigrinus ALCF2SS1-7]